MFVVYCCTRSDPFSTPNVAPLSIPLATLHSDNAEEGWDTAPGGDRLDGLDCTRCLQYLLNGKRKTKSSSVN